MHARKLLAVLITPGVVLAGVGQASAAQGEPISEADVLRAQEIWAEAIVSIGEAYTSQEDYEALAEDVVDTLYGYDEGIVLFKPTKASQMQFRSNREEAISYFVTGDVDEDSGFAIQPWSEVRFDNHDILLAEETAYAMGNYHFTDADSGEDVMVEYTFGYFRDDDGELRIKLHHSSLPYSPQE